VRRIDEAEDPVRAVLEAHERGRPVALLTSGTSGAPRAVVRTTASWVGSFPYVAELTGLDRDSRVWLPGPRVTTMNLFAAVHAAWAGARVVEEPATATHVHLTPARLAEALDDGTDLSGRHLVVAGDRLGSHLAERAASAGARVSHYYGAAELSFVAWGGHEHDLRPFPGVEVDLRDGEIWARSPYLCDGYDGPAGPLRRDGDGFATVGDHGRLEAGVLHVLGRGEQAVTVGGATVHVTDVEAALQPHLSGEVAVLGVPHGRLGQVLAAVLTDDRERESARRAAADLLAGAGRPRVWFHLPRLPVTHGGKLDRSTLAALVTGGDARRLG
jgi:acyl-CoA synthetase (AMP-forming)/AMP-acid ligase II